MELRRYLEIFNRRKRVFYYVFGASLVLSLLVLLLIRPTYKASAKVLVSKTTFANGMLATWGLTSQVTVSGDDVKTDVELSRIKPLAQSVIDEYKLKGLFGAPLKADDFFEPDLASSLFSLPYAIVKQYKEASMIEIGVISRDPEMSASAANTLASDYIEGVIQRTKSDFKSVREALESKRETLRDDYFRALALATNIKLRDMTIDLSGETTNIIKAITTLKTEAETIDKESVQLEVEIAKGTKQLEKLAEYRKEGFEIAKNSRLESLKTTLDKKILEQATQKFVITKEHPNYKLLNEEIDTIKRQMADEADLILTRESKSLNPVYTEIARKIIMNRIAREVYLARKAVIQKFIKLYEDELIKIPHKFEEAARLEPVLTATKDMYTKASQYAVQAGLAESMHISKLKVVEPATTPKKKFYPRRGRTLLSAAFLGFFLGLAAIFLVEYMDNTVKSKADIADPSKFLGRIPYSDGLRNYETLKSLGGDSKEIEAADEIKDNIFYETSGKMTLPLIITSPKKGDGKTCTAALLAIAYARDGLRVLLVDAGAPVNSAASFFGIVPDNSGVPMPTRENGLEVLRVPNINRFTEIAGSVRDSYAQVIIDTGSPGDCAAIDGSVICVIEPYKHEKDILNRLSGITNFAGYVFNKADTAS
ncbi:MAG: hypothetical protein HQK99_05645 [Nitrospirae bacterium]|nr:hypothetical protein [Nitrospirota bacterium]